MEMTFVTILNYILHLSFESVFFIMKSEKEKGG